MNNFKAVIHSSTKWIRNKHFGKKAWWLNVMAAEVHHQTQIQNRSVDFIHPQHTWSKVFIYTVQYRSSLSFWPVKFQAQGNAPHRVIFIICDLLHFSLIQTTVNVLKVNPLNAKLNPICHLLALLGGATIVVVSRLRVKHILYTCMFNMKDGFSIYITVPDTTAPWSNPWGP